MHTPSDVIKLYLQMRENKKKLTAEYEAKVAEIDTYMQAAEGFLLKTMNDREETQIKTEFGTAFRAPQMRTSMVDRDATIAWTMKSQDFRLFTNHVSKDGVKSYIEEFGVHPPGIQVETFITCNVRKA